jgi:Phage portal protein
MKPRIQRRLSKAVTSAGSSTIPPIDQYNQPVAHGHRAGPKVPAEMITYQDPQHRPKPEQASRINQTGISDRGRSGGGKELQVSQQIIDAVVQGVRDQVANLDPAHWFGPNQPLRPIAQEAAKGRLIDYTSGYNLKQMPREEEPITFEMLRGLADNCDLLRVVLETRKDQVEAIPWSIKVKSDYADSQVVAQKQDKGKANPTQLEWLSSQATRFFENPSTESDWSGWIRMIMEDLMVIDAVALYPRWMMDGSLYSIDVMDAAHIKRVIDEGGRTPLPPNPAYQQRVRGVLAADYSADELLYFMRNPRSNKFYGYSAVEQIIVTVNTAIRKALHQLQFFTEGNIPEAIAGVPETWTMEQIAEFQIYWDSLIEGNTAQRRHMKFMPLDPTKIKEVKPPELKDMYDEWLARIICFCFSISPSQLVKDSNRATAETVAEQSRKEGLLPLLSFLKRKLDRLLAKYLKMPELEFHWDIEEEVDPATQAAIDQIYVTLKVRTADEVRKDRFGQEPLSDDEKREAFGATPMDQIQRQQDQDNAAAEQAKEASPPAAGKAGGAGAKSTGPAALNPARSQGIKGPGGVEKMIGKLVVAPTINIPPNFLKVGDVNVTADLGSAIDKLMKQEG